MHSTNVDVLNPLAGARSRAQQNSNTGPLISGPGAAGAAIQDVEDALGSHNPTGIVIALIGAPATLVDGVVNGGFGTGLDPLVGNLSPLLLRAGD